MEDATFKDEALVRLRKGWGASFDHPKGTVYLIPVAICREGGTGVIITQEGWGCLRYEGSEPLQEFDLQGAGFPVDVSRHILELMHTLFGSPVSNETTQGPMVPRLESQ